MRCDYRESFHTNTGYIAKHNDIWEMFEPEPRKVNYRDLLGKKQYDHIETVFIRVAQGTSDLKESLEIFGINEKELRA